MIVHDSHQRDEVEPTRQRIVEKIAAMRDQAHRSPRRNGRQIENGRYESRMRGADRPHENPRAAPDIKQPPMATESVCSKHLLRNHCLGSGHERRIRRHNIRRFVAPFVIGPIGRELPPAPAAPQQRDRIGKIGIKQCMMLDHFGDTGAAMQRRPLRPEHVASVGETLGEVDRRRGFQQPLGGCHRKIGNCCHIRHRQGSCSEARDQPRAHASQHDLRVDKAIDQIEQAFGLCPRHWPH